RCLAQCAALGTEAQKHVDRLGEQAAARRQGSTWRLPKEVCGATRRRCDVLHEAFCSGLQCQLNGSGAVGVWLPLKTAAQPPPVSPGGLARSEGYLAAHMRCARRCASQQYLTVELGRPLSRAAIADAAARLEECGLVHLSGGAWPEQSLSRLQAAAAALLGLPADQQAALRRGPPSSGDVTCGQAVNLTGGVPIPLPFARFSFGGPPGWPSSSPLDSPRKLGQNAPRERSGE
ncbi:unnamed protein product, partial [Prorocentrum cordatum]